MKRLFSILAGAALFLSASTAARAVDAYPINLTDVNGTLFFQAFDSTHGVELWKSDGTPAGTEMVKDINPTGNANLVFLTNVNGTLFFQANDGVHGAELWKSDGYEAGTVMVKDINPNGSSFPVNLACSNGLLYFQANDGKHGTQLWVSDGTEAGTVMLTNVGATAAANPEKHNNSFYASLAGHSQTRKLFLALNNEIRADKNGLQGCLLMISNWIHCEIPYFAYVE
jgi:ELWxxDGT repeat protein